MPTSPCTATHAGSRDFTTENRPIRLSEPHRTDEPVPIRFQPSDPWTTLTPFAPDCAPPSCSCSPLHHFDPRRALRLGFQAGAHYPVRATQRNLHRNAPSSVSNGTTHDHHRNRHAHACAVVHPSRKRSQPVRRHELPELYRRNLFADDQSHGHHDRHLSVAAFPARRPPTLISGRSDIRRKLVLAA